MTVRPISIAAVSYLNTIPFLYGIRHAADLRAELLLSPPSGCAEAFNSRKADIALIPVGGLAEIAEKDFDIITTWCLGADGPVRTVVMVSDSPIKEIKRVWLDSHSMTSVLLAKYLAAKYWNIAPEWKDLADYSVLEKPAQGDAFVLIGDKVFENEGRFKNTWDLAEEWRKHERLPFVFAVWVARKSVPEETLAALEDALTLGIERIYESILESDYAGRNAAGELAEAGYPNAALEADRGLCSIDIAYDYLTRNIDYIFDGQKRKALERFWNSGMKAVPRANPG